MTSLPARRRLVPPLVTAVLMAMAFVLLPSAPASALVTQGVSGHVTGPSGASLKNIEVAFLVDVGGGNFGYLGSTATDALGNYTMPLDPGTYRVAFADSVSGNYVTEFWNNSLTFDGATDVSVTSSHVTNSINAQLAAAGHITGHAAGGTGGWVLAWSESSPGAGDWQPWTFADVDPTGDFDLGGLTTGAYRVEFHVDEFAPEFWQDKADLDSATSIQVTAPATVSGINPTLTPVGHVTGHLQDSEGAGIADAWVDAYVFDGTDWVYADDAWAFTDQNGDFDMAAPPGTYRLEFSADGFVSEYYDDKHSVDAADDVVVTSGSTVSGKDAVLDVGASISGTVTLPPGADPYEADGLVTAVDPATNEVEGYGFIDTESGSGNSYPYTVDGLPAGSYRVEFARVPGWATSEAQFYDGHPESDLLSSADPVTLAAGQQQTGVDATLRAGGTISGRVVDGNGDPVVGCEVAAFNKVKGVDKYVPRVGTTGDDGSFVVKGLTSGQYGLLVGDPFQVGNDCPTTEYYTNTNGDLSESPQNPAEIVPVSAAPGADTALENTLVYGGSVPVPDVKNVTPPTVPSSAPVVGTPVPATAGTWQPADAGLTYQWQADGVDIANAHAASYTPVTADVGKSLTVTVTAAKAGYNSASQVSNPTAPVTAPSQAPAIANTSAPGISGIPRVGLQLSADAGTWYTQAGAPTTTVQWLRNGVPVPGATGSTYPLGADDLGARISLRVTAARDGYQPSTVTSASTEPVSAGILTLTDVPRMLGVLKVGKVLRALPPASSPTATGVRFQWLRNGKPIKGPAAKRARYRLVSADRGKRISVRVTVLLPGYTPTTSVAKKAGRVR